MKRQQQEEWESKSSRQRECEKEEEEEEATREKSISCRSGHACANFDADVDDYYYPIENVCPKTLLTIIIIGFSQIDRQERYNIYANINLQIRTNKNDNVQNN